MSMERFLAPGAVFRPKSEPPPKRKPGRPPKERPQVPSEAGAPEQEQQALQPQGGPQKKRGRPPQDEQQVSEEAQECADALRPQRVRRTSSFKVMQAQAEICHLAREVSH